MFLTRPPGSPDCGSISVCPAVSRRVKTNGTVKPYTGIRGRSKINQAAEFILTQSLMAGPLFKALGGFYIQ
jgi:hypothetical protein